MQIKTAGARVYFPPNALVPLHKRVFSPGIRIVQGAGAKVSVRFADDLTLREALHNKS